MSKFDYKSASVAQINTAIASIQKRGVPVVADVQMAALACLVQVQEHGNVSPLNALYLAVEGVKGLRSTALAQWAVKFGSVEINPDSAARKVLPLSYVKGKVDIAAAIELPWFKFKSEASIDEMVDVEKALDSLIKRLGKAAAVSNPELVKRIVALRTDAIAASNAGSTAGTLVAIGAAVPALPALPSLN